MMDVWDKWHALAGQLPFEWAEHEFMQNALLAILLISPLFALIGCLVINNQMAFFSDAIGHATLTGIAIGGLMGVTGANLTWPMMFFSVMLAVLVSLLRRWSAVSTDTLIGLTMAFAVALGVVLLSRIGGFTVYGNFLVGDLLYVTRADILRLAIGLAVVVVLWVFFFNRFMLVFLNRSLAQSRGEWAWTMEAFFASVVAMVVAMSISCVGLLVVNSLLIIPAATARNLAGNARQYLFLAVLFSLIAGVTGLHLSYVWGTAGGATVVLVAMGLYLATLPLRR